MKRKKIDNDGTFLKFPGVTAIANVRPEDQAIWDGIHDALEANPLVKSYCSVLPSSSYHMTVNNLFIQKDWAEDKWRRFLNRRRDFFKRLHDELASEPFTPELEVQSVITDRSITLEVNLPEAQVERIKAVAEKFDIENKVPDPFHITLAYKHKLLDEDKQQQVHEQIVDIINEYLPDGRITLQQAGLYYFDDMTAFMKWDGVTYPFESAFTQEVSSASTSASSLFYASSSSGDTSEEAPGPSIAP